MNKRKYAQLSLSLAAMLMAAPVWAAEQNQSAADVVANQTMTIGGKEQIVSRKRWNRQEKRRKNQANLSLKRVRTANILIICITILRKIFLTRIIKVTVLKNPAAGL